MVKEKTIHPPVFYTSATFVITLVLLGIFFTEQFEEIILSINDWITSYFGWFYIIAVTLFLLFCLYLLFSKHTKNIKLGATNAKPDYSYFNWLSMLFSAGMGIGLLFYGVAEPMLHYTNPPLAEPGTEAAIVEAMDYSFLHWGLHGWAIYAIVGLALAYFGFRHNHPLSIRYTLYPLFKEKVYGKLGDAIDVIAVLGTMFGVTTSLGLGAMQVNSGISFLSGIPESQTVQLLLILSITFIATLSVVSGVGRGVKWLSVTNVILGGLFMLFILFMGPTAHLFEAFFVNAKNYIIHLPQLSILNNFQIDSAWKNIWTIFYWAWWISWAPYVGMFIARISRGRTVREFLFGVLFVPTIITLFWFTIFGNTSIFLHQNGETTIAPMVVENVSQSLFAFLANFPIAVFLSIFAIFIIISFFVTSADSGSLVIDIITSGGNVNPTMSLRIFWAFIQGIVAATLLLGGGLIALQTMVLTLALPFTFILFAITISLFISFRKKATGDLQADEKVKKKMVTEK
jgi:choline/glycine/proline betaine transport protein